MASKAYTDVASTFADNPGWDATKVSAALKGKYTDAQLNTAIGQYLGGIASGQVTYDAAAAKKKVIQKWANATEVTADILNKATSSDPTAGGQTLTTGVLNPLTNKPIAGSIPTGNAGLSPYVNNVNADFVGNPAAQIAPRLSTGIDKYGNQYVQLVDLSTGAGHKVYVFGDPDNTGQYQVVDYVRGAQDFIRSYTAKGPNGVKELKDFLVSQKILTGKAGRLALDQGNVIDNTTAKGVQKYLDELTTTNFNKGPQAGFIPVGGDTATGVSSLTTKAFSNTNFTPEDLAARDYTSFVQEQLGRGATAKEINDYTKALHDFEAAHPDRGTVTTDTLGVERNKVTYNGATAQDKQAIMVGMLFDALSKKGINPDDISAAGGALGRGMQDLQAYAASYGLGHIDKTHALNSIIEQTRFTAQKATSQDTLDMIKDTLKPGGSIDQKKTQIREQAKMVYKPLASYIETGGSVKDIADQYNNLNQKYLENYNPTDVFNPDIQKALQGDGKNIMGYQDYIGMLKAKPEWAMTMNAREQAASFATDILKSFGMMA